MNEQEITGENYYANFYPDYAKQNPPEKIEFYLNLLRKNVPSQSQIFELGVGKGIFLGKAAKEFKCAGCDINEAGIAETAKLIPTAKLSIGSTEAFEAFARTTPVQAVVSWDVLEHLPNISDSLKRIYAALPTGGVLIGVVPVYDGPLGFLVHLLDKDPTHVTKTGRGDWVRMLESSGFTVKNWGGILRKLLPGGKYMHLTENQSALRIFGSAMYFVAVKN